MQKDAALEGETIADYTVLKLPIMLGSLALTMLSFLIPIYAKQLGASAVGIGGLFAVAQGMIVLLRPVIGWTSDRFGRKGFFVAGMVCHTGAMGLFVLASNVTMLYLAQLLYGVASAVTWTSAYTITTELATPAHRGKAVGRVDEYAHRGALYGMVLALVVLSWLALHTAWRVLFLSYAALAAAGIWLAWKRVPETRSPSPPQAGPQSMASWPFVQVLLVVFLSYLFTSHAPPGVFSVLTRRVYPGCAPPGPGVPPGDAPGEFPPLTPGAPERPLGPPATHHYGLDMDGAELHLYLCLPSPGVGYCPVDTQNARTCCGHTTAKGVDQRSHGTRSARHGVWAIHFRCQSRCCCWAVAGRLGV